MWDYEIREIDNWTQDVLEERKFAGNRYEQRFGGIERDRQTDRMNEKFCE